MAIAFAAFALQAWLFQHRLDAPVPPILTDFNDYHVVGRMVAAGRAIETYDWPTLKLEQIVQTRNWSFMPWAYPPPFTMLVGLLGLLPIWAAYLLFMAVTWLLFYAAMVRLAGRATIPALFVILPSLIINGKGGQAGFLSAAFIGWFLVFLRERSAKAGWPLGAMIFKPHLAAGIGLLALIERRWGAMVRAVVLIAASFAVATLVLGVEIWPAFQKGTSTASEYLWTGFYPLERMLTVFAALHRFGVPAVAAMVVHLTCAAALVLAVALAWWRKARTETVFALTVCVCLMTSPYTYDYDGVALGLAYAMVLPRFVARAGRYELPIAVLLSWIATSNYLWSGLRQYWYGVPIITHEMQLWTISPIALAALGALVIVVLRRPARPDAPWLRAYSWMAGRKPG